MGFSIGGSVALQVAADSTVTDIISSVVAVAAPYRVGDINFRLSGDLKNPLESLASSVYAFDRAGLARISYMVLIGMPLGLLRNSAVPGNLLRSVTAPTLLVHGADDWLTKSYHSVKMFELADSAQSISLVSLETRTHAEDMISRESASLRQAFLNTIGMWLDFIQSEDLPKSKDPFNRSFHNILQKSTSINKHIYPESKITLMDAPAFNDLYANLWNTPPAFNHSHITFNTLHTLGDKSLTRIFATVGSTKLNPSFIERIRFGMAIELYDNQLDNLESYWSLYYPVGSFLWLRRVSYISGVGNEINRKILSADLAYLVVDFQVNYGRFFDRDRSWLISVNAPLMGTASGWYFLGVGYSHFFHHTRQLTVKGILNSIFTLAPRLRHLTAVFI